MFNKLNEGKINGLEYAIDILNMNSKGKTLEILYNTLAQLKLINFEESEYLKR